MLITVYESFKANNALTDLHNLQLFNPHYATCIRPSWKQFVL